MTSRYTIWPTRETGYAPLASGRVVDCLHCLASGNPRGGKACGHYAPTADELARSRELAAERAAREAARPVCRVCGDAECLAARKRGRPMLCD